MPVGGFQARPRRRSWAARRQRCWDTYPDTIPVVFPRALLLATNSEGKVGELREILAGVPLELLTPRAIGLDLEVEETGETFEENAVLKATAFARAAGLAALADDSGLEIDA